MRRRSKSVFVGAEVAHYMNSKHFGAENDDEENEVNNTTNLSASYEEEDVPSAEDSSNEDGDDGESVLHLIQQVHGQIPANDKLPFDQRLNVIDWNAVNVPNAKRRILNVIESERRHRLLHEVLDDAHKTSIKKLDIKKPTSTIGLFIAENKVALRKVMEKNGSKNIITTANEEFKKISDEERQSYIERANCAKGSYNQEIKKYTLTFKKGGTKTKAVKVKKLSPFVLFQTNHELKGADTPRSELMKKFNDLPPNKKLIWILRYLGVNQGDKVCRFFNTCN